MKLHHLTFEVSSDRLTEETLFWGILGFGPIGLRRRERKSKPIHWLVNQVNQCAIELLPVKYPTPTNLAHICITGYADTFDKVINQLFVHGFRWDQASDYFGFKRAFAHSPSGYVVEILSGNPSINVGPPLEET